MRGVGAALCPAPLFSAKSLLCRAVLGAVFVWVENSFGELCGCGKVRFEFGEGLDLTGVCFPQP